MFKSILPQGSCWQKSVVLLMLLFALSSWAFGQVDQSRISGKVQDQNAGVIPGATIKVKNDRTGEERTAVSSDQGLYLITGLKPSTYTVTVFSSNFAAKTINKVVLLLGQEATLDVILSPQGATESINIQAGADLAISTDSASMGASVNSREVEALPLNGRQLSQLYLQAPGSVNSGSGTFGDIRFNGRAVEQNAVRYDGIEGSAIIDAAPGNLNGQISSPFRLQSSLENVQEFRVESSNYSAEFGTGTGGQISVITKSGSNAFHGSVFEYLRNDKMDAANFFDHFTSKAPLRLNQFGGSIGGPIVKDKFFFFFSYEGYRLRAGVNSVESVPGLQSRICAPAPNGLPCVESSGIASRTLNLLPAFRDPRAVPVLVGTGTNLFDVVELQDKAAVNERAVALRLDYKLGSRHSIYGRYFRDDGNLNQPEGVTGRRISFVDNPQNEVIGWQYILTPSVINEVKVGYNSIFSRTNGIAPTINGIDLSKLTVNLSGNTASFNIPGQGTSAGVANPGGLIRANSATNGRAQPYTAFSESFIDDLSWVKGSHNLKFGGEIRLNRFYTDQQGGSTYVFNDLTTFLSNRPASIQYLGDLSDPSPFNNGATGFRKGEFEFYIGYAQDEWKVRPNLTVNYGLRYEYYTPMGEARNLDVVFDTVTGTLKPADSTFFRTSKTSFAPRLGIALSPNFKLGDFFTTHQTVIRAGFGINYGPGQIEDQIQPIESDRVGSTLSSGPLLVFDTDQTAFINLVRANFINNPNNRQYQPRAYTPDYLVPERVYSYTVSLQQELPYQMVATFAYVGSQGRNLFLRGLSNTFRQGATSIVDGSALPAGFGIINRTDPVTGRVIGVTTVREFDIINSATACGGPNICKPFAEIDTKTSGGTDTYNSFQFTLARRFSNGLTLNSQYTFGKSLGTTSGSNEARTAAQPFGGSGKDRVHDFNNYDADYGYNSFDVRHVFNLSAIYDLPIGKGKRWDFGNSAANTILGNWEIGTILNARSGLPLDVTITRPDVVIQCTNPALGCNANEVRALPGTVNATSPLPAGFTAVVNAPGGGSSRQTRRPDLIPGVNPYLGINQNFLNPAAFATPKAGTFGNLGRNALTGPNFRQFDLIFNKRFRLTENTNMEFRTEVFNIFNRTNFANPGSTLGSALGTGTNQLQPGQPFTQAAAGSTFGLLRSTVERTVGLGTNRQIQFALRINF